MAERNIRTARALRKRLAEQGVMLSEPQVGRVINHLPRLMNTKILAALCAVLDTTPGELLVIPGKRSAPPQLDDTVDRSPHAHQSATVLTRAVTSDLTAIPAVRPREGLNNSPDVGDNSASRQG